MLLGHLHDLLPRPGPLVSSIQEPLVQQQESVALPDEALDLVGLSAAEHKQHILLERIDPQFTPDDCGQSVDALAEIRISAGDVDPVEASGVIQHGASPAVPAPASVGRHP